MKHIRKVSATPVRAQSDVLSIILGVFSTAVNIIVPVMSIIEFVDYVGKKNNTSQK